MNWIMEDGYGKLKEKAQHREEWSRWRFGHTERQIDLKKKKRKIKAMIIHTSSVV